MVMVLVVAAPCDQVSPTFSSPVSEPRRRPGAGEPGDQVGHPQRPTVLHREEGESVAVSQDRVRILKRSQLKAVDFITLR